MKLVNRCQYYPNVKEFICCEPSNKIDCIFRIPDKYKANCSLFDKILGNCHNLDACELAKNNFIHNLKQEISNCEITFNKLNK